MNITQELMQKAAANYIQEKTIRNEQGCWIWQGCTSNGYGQCKFRMKRWSAHRLTYFAFIGEIPEEHFVSHKCQNRACCNPDHLELLDEPPSTFLTKKSSKYNNGRLNLEKAKHIKQLLRSGVFTQKEIAQIFDVSDYTISKVSTGKAWSEA